MVRSSAFLPAIRKHSCLTNVFFQILIFFLHFLFRPVHFHFFLPSTPFFLCRRGRAERSFPLHRTDGRALEPVRGGVRKHLDCRNRIPEFIMYRVLSENQIVPWEPLFSLEKRMAEVTVSAFFPTPDRGKKGEAESAGSSGIRDIFPRNLLRKALPSRLIFRRSTDIDDIQGHMCDFSDLNEMVKLLEGKLLRYAGGFLKNPAAAQDAVQEAFLRYIRYRREKGGPPADNLSAWLFKATRNICLDGLKSSRSRLETAYDDAAAGKDVDPDRVFSAFETPAESLLREDDIQTARTLISTLLTAREQEILALKFEHAKSYSQIAEILDLSVSHVGVILHHAMKKLQAGFREIENGGTLPERKECL